MAVLTTITPKLAVEVTLDPASVAANVAAAQNFTVTGLNVGDAVHVEFPTLEANLVVTNAFVSAKNTLSIRFGNMTAAPIDPGSQTVRILAF